MKNGYWNQGECKARASQTSYAAIGSVHGGNSTEHHENDFYSISDVQDDAFVGFADIVLHYVSEVTCSVLFEVKPANVLLQKVFIKHESEFESHVV